MMKNEVKSRKFCETDDYITMEYFLKREGSRTNDSHIPIIRRLITIGRSPNCTITLKSIRVSRLQCEIIYSDENIFLRDTQSSNGTYVNNEKLTNEMRKLEVGDYIGFGVNPLPKRTYDSNQFVFSLQKYQSVQSVEIADDDNVDGKSSNEIMDHTYNLDPVDNLTLKNTNSDDFLIQYDFKFSDDEVKQTSINHQKEIDLKYDKPNRESILTLFNDSDDANDCMASRSTQSTADVQIENKGLLVNRCETVDSKLCDAKKETAKKDVQDVKVLFFRQDSKNIGSKSRRIGDNSSAVRKRSKNSSKPSSKKFVDSLKMSKEPSTLIELLKRPLQPGKGQLEPTKYFDVEVIRIDDSNENTLDWSEVNNPNTMNISSNFSHMTSNFGNLTSNFGTLTSNLGSLTSNFSQSASNFSHTAPKIDNKATHYGNLTSKVDNITSKVDNITSKSSTSTNPEYQPSTSEALRKHLMSKTSTPGPLLNSKIIQKPSNVQVIRRLSIDCRNQMTHTDPASNARTMTSKVPITPPKLELIRRYSTEKSKIINKVPNLGTESTVINKILPRFPTTSGTKSETITSGLYAQKYQTVDLTSAPNDTYGTFETDSGNRKFSLDYYNNVTDNEDDCKFIGQIVMDNPGPMRSFGGQAGSSQQVLKILT
ncbi:uncharacterized protein hog [Chironomus tepperi]|uniref:uncharacterized protein hog n=1 Tax=Chironomus tepperi TaxID=113505 RepID=UPI00391F8E5B